MSIPPSLYLFFLALILLGVFCKSSVHLHFGGATTRIYVIFILQGAVPVVIYAFTFWGRAPRIYFISIYAILTHLADGPGIWD